MKLSNPKRLKLLKGHFQYMSSFELSIINTTSIKKYTVLLILSICISCQTSKPKYSEPSKSLVKYVNPFIGTGGHGHTYPGATMPFGMIQISPDTRLDGWDGCSGYHYNDSIIYGFSHTHLSGTGVSDYGDILLMPTNKVSFNNGANGEPGYKDYFSHQNEVAQAGYYEVKLDSSAIEVALTANLRSGMHKYNYPNSDHQFVILDLNHRDELLAGEIKQLNERELNGFRFSKAWAKDQRVFYHIRFSVNIKNILYNSKESPTVAAIELSNPNNEKVHVSIGISAVDAHGAKINLETEIGDMTFEEVKNHAQEKWENQLGKILIESTDEESMTVFYTALYHSMIAPNLYQDVDGRYRGMDMKIHQDSSFEYYTVFSLWDTYRATHPLYTIIEQERTNDFINTMIAKYKEGGELPIWDLSANYTGCMIGYHAVPVIADAYLKNIRSYDAKLAFEAMKHSSTRDKLGLAAYKQYSFIPMEEESESVSKTLEYAYDDWTIAQMAKSMGQEKDFKTYIERAQYYKNIFDPGTNFMRGRIHNKWFEPFDPFEVNFNYTEANAWQYSYYVPHDISGFIKFVGGKDKLDRHLDAIFSASPETTGRNQADITGLIGQYAHGNEPSHHIAYLYNFVNKPHKTQERVHQIMNSFYTNEPAGISGNEDCGQMSAWYIFSALGFYPVTPASSDYIIGKPLFDKATIQLENGKTFVIEAKNLSKENIYIKSVSLNGKDHPYSFIKHQSILQGGKLIFEMTANPTDWATQDDHAPITAIDSSYQIVPVPFIDSGEIAFQEKTKISLGCALPEATIFYRLGKKSFKKYSEAFIIQEPSILEIYAQYKGKQSKRIHTKFSKIDPNITIDLLTSYDNQYNGGGNKALIDGRIGGNDFKTGAWQGYFGKDIIAILDLGSIKQVHTIKMGFLQDQRSWIFFPSQVEYYGSIDGKKYERIGLKEIDAVQASEKVEKLEVELEDLNGSFQYIKIHARNIGALPEWHLGFKEGGQCWLFADEIKIQ